MRVALCLSGQTRTYKKCFDSQYKYILARYSPDVFIHTWLYDGLYPKTSDNLHYCANYNIDNYDKYLNDNHLIQSDIFSLYKPKKCSVEHPDKNYFIQQSPVAVPKFFNAIMMYYSIFYSNRLKQEYELQRNFKYDFVIRCRFDLYFEKFVLLPENDLYLAPNENIGQVFTPEMKELLALQGPKYMPNDQFAHGSSDAMDYYSSVYMKYLENKHIFPIHPEGILSKHLWEYNNRYVPQINHNIHMKIYT